MEDLVLNIFKEIGRKPYSFFRAIITSLSEGVERSTALNGVMGSIRETTV